MNTKLETQEKISSIIASKYNNYNGRLLKPLSLIHKKLKILLGEERFLFFLEEQERINPAPKYGN